MTSPLKKYLAAALLLLPFAAPAAQPESHPAAQVGAQEFILRDSAGLKREYRIQVAAVGKAPAGGYPVLYVLDGDALFPMVTGAAQNMVMRAEENNAVPLLIVGVGYPNGELFDFAARAEDYTPPSADYAQSGDRMSKRFGGGEHFHRFLTGRLRDEIAARYPVNRSQQWLMGHSYGGLFTLYSLLEHPGSFNNYLAASPSVWWNQRRILESIPPFVKNAAKLKKQTAGRAPLGLRITVGEYEQTLVPWMPQEAARKELLEKRGMVRDAHHIAQELSAVPPQVLHSEWKLYPQETHATVLLPAINDNLKWLFARCKADDTCRPQP